MSRRGKVLLTASLLAADGLGVALAIGVAQLLTLGLGEQTPSFASTLLRALPAWWATFALVRLYDLETVLEDSQEYATVATGCAYGSLVLTALSLTDPARPPTLAWLVIVWATSAVTVGLGRFSMRRVVRAMRRRGHLIGRAVVVGADEQGRAIARQLRSLVDSGLRVLGFVDDFLPIGTPVEDGLQVIGHPGGLAELVRDLRVAEVVVVPGALAWESFQEILERLSGAGGPRVRLSPGYYDLLATTPRVAHRNFVPLIVLDRARLGGVDGVLKAAIDYGLGGLALLLLAPLVLLIALGLRLTRRGVFERQTFLGIGGQAFHAHAFRLTPESRLSAVLQATGLHRLPLLLAVAGSRMSLVGPRPIQPHERAGLRRWWPTLSTVKPGVTGPWAVVPVASLEEEMRAAIYYVRNWTIWVDLQILVQTVLVVLRRRWGRVGL